jgi:hypothetical protein
MHVFYRAAAKSTKQQQGRQQQQGTAVFIDGLTIVWIRNETIATASAAAVKAVSPVTLA